MRLDYLSCLAIYYYYHMYPYYPRMFPYCNFILCITCKIQELYSKYYNFECFLQGMSLFSKLEIHWKYK